MKPSKDMTNPVKPKALSNRNSSRLWFTVSNAADKSRSKRETFSPLSSDSMMSLVTDCRAVSVLWNVKPRPNDRNIVGRNVLRHVRCWCLKFDQFQTWANNTQHAATHRNTVAKRTQHVAPNNVATCWVGMLGSFGRGLKDTCVVQFCTKCFLVISSYTAGYQLVSHSESAD